MAAAPEFKSNEERLEELGLVGLEERKVEPWTWNVSSSPELFQMGDWLV